MLTINEVEAKSFRFSVNEEGREICHAWLYLIRNDLHPGRPYGLLEDVWVAPDYRSKGRGKELVLTVIARARQCGCYKLIATSRLQKTKVHALYKEIGFTIHGHEFRMDFLEEGES